MIQVKNIKWCMQQIQFKEFPIEHMSDWHSWISIRLLNQWWSVVSSFPTGDNFTGCSFENPSMWILYRNVRFVSLAKTSTIWNFDVWCYTWKEREAGGKQTTPESGYSLLKYKSIGLIIWMKKAGKFSRSFVEWKK